MNNGFEQINSGPATEPPARRERPPRTTAGPEVLPASKYEDLPEPEKVQVTENALALVAQALAELDDYVVFASTAKYLQGMDKNKSEWQQPPGDLDISVGSIDELRRMNERLSNVPGVKFETDEHIGKMPGEDTYRLAGTIPITIEQNGRQIQVPYAFEAFCQSRIVNKQVSQHKEKLHGINVLNIEGIERQLQGNIEFESKILKQVEQVAEYLTNPEIKSQILDAEGQVLDSAAAAEAMQQFELDKAQLQEFYDLSKQYAGGKLNDPVEKEKFDKKISVLLAGESHKVKLAKRLRDLSQLRGE